MNAVGLYAVILISMFRISTGQRTGQNLLVISKHEPATGGNLVPKSQQSLLVSPDQTNQIKRFIFPNQIHDSFLPRGFLSDPVATRVVSPTVISPVSTTALGSGFDGITESINTFISAVQKKTDLLHLKKSFPTGISRESNVLSGLIKNSAKNQIDAVLSNTFESTKVDNGRHVSTSRGFLESRNGKTQHAQGRHPGSSLKRKLVPLVIRKQNLQQQVTDNKISIIPRLALSRPVGQSNPSPPLLFAPRRNHNSRSSTTSVRASSVQSLPAADTARTVPLLSNVRAAQRQSSSATGRLPNRQISSVIRSSIQSPSRPRSAVNVPSLLTSRRSRPSTTRVISNNRQPLLNVARNTVVRQQTNRNRNTQTTRTRQATTVTRQRTQQQQQQAAARSNRCPSRADCRVVSPANCRRPTYITDDNGRRLCRGCDQDSCSFGGFEGRWGSGFG